MSHRAMLAAALAVATGCDLDDVENQRAACASGKLVQLTELVGLPATMTADVVVKGQLVRPGDVTVAKLYIGLASATNDGNDFEKFDAQITLADVMRLIPVGAPPTAAVEVTLPIAAVTNCGTEQVTIDSRTVSLAPRGSGELTLQVDPTPSQGYLPPSMVPLKLVVRATAGGSAAGAVVKLSTTSGTIGGAAAADITLGEDGRASVYFVPDGKEGEAVIQARSGSSIATALSVKFIGAPAIQPSNVPLYLDTVLQIMIDRRGGTIPRCRAAAPPGVTVLSGAHDLTREDTLDPTATVNITASTGVADKSVVSLRCFDVFGQTTTAAYTVSL